MTAGFMRTGTALRSLVRKRLRMPFIVRSSRSLRAPASLAVALILCATAACSQHDDDRAALTDSAARELAGTRTPQVANSITAFAAVPDTSGSNDTSAANAGANANAVTLPPLAVSTPARPPADGSPGIDPLVTPVIHTAD